MLGPADIIFTTGERVVVKWAGILGQTLGMSLLSRDPLCRCLQEPGVIYINSGYYSLFTTDSPPGNKFYFPTTVRHEIGHSVGLADVYEFQSPLPIMYHEQVRESIHINVRQVRQDDINGLGCLYGGNFNWGNETFTLSKPESGDTYKCKIPLEFGGCNGLGNLYNVKIYVKYDANNPASPWQYVTTLQNVRGCRGLLIGRKKSSQYTRVKVKWFSGGNLKDSIISRMFSYIYWPTICPEARPDFISSSKCGCDSINILNFSILTNFEKIEVFDITGRRVFLSEVRNKEFFKGAIENLPKGIYFLRIITREKVHIKKITLGTK